VSNDNEAPNVRPADISLPPTSRLDLTWLVVNVVDHSDKRRGFCNAP
jgi:hypothetical protein